jgi:hypothetical protein
MREVSSRASRVNLSSHEHFLCSLIRFTLKYMRLETSKHVSTECFHRGEPLYERCMHGRHVQAFNLSGISGISAVFPYIYEPIVRLSYCAAYEHETSKMSTSAVAVSVRTACWSLARNAMSNGDLVIQEEPELTRISGSADRFHVLAQP